MLRRAIASAVITITVCVIAPASLGAATSHAAARRDRCDAKPLVRTTDAGVDFVRTPKSCFRDLPKFPYTPRHVEIDGLRQGYVEAGPRDGEVVLLLHGQPSWSYLYRKMIPVLAQSGYRVIAMDHLGFGYSDKPTEVASYSYVGHIQRLEAFVEALRLSDITVFVQDWGSLIGLHVVGNRPDWFARVVVGDGTLPVVPAGLQPYPPVEDPDALRTDLDPPLAGVADQQPEFFDAEGNAIPGALPPAGRTGDRDPGFATWMAYAMTSTNFHPAVVVEALTYFDLPPSVEDAYDAPYPSRTYLTGPRTFPSLVNELQGQNQEPWAGLMAFAKPFLTIWASNDPGNLGTVATQQRLIDNIPGAAGQPHTRLPEASHFLQDDQGREIARRMVAFLNATPRTAP